MLNGYIPRMSVVAALVSFASLLESAIGQVQYVVAGDAYWTWEISADGGVTWRSGVTEVPQSQGSVSVRARCLFEQPTINHHFGVVWFDATVDGIGAADQIRDLGFGGTRMAGALSHINTQRFGDLLKIDWETDVAPPGIGSAWLSPGNSGPGVPVVPDASNPFVAMSYTIDLDGSPGDRMISGTYRDDYPPFPPGQWALVFQQGNTFTGFVQALHDFPATIRVVPSPIAAIILGYPFACVRTRRAKS